MIERRSFITGLVSLVAAPAIVRAGSLMPVRVVVEAEPMWIPVGNSQWRDLLDAQREINMRHSLVRARRWITKAKALEMFPDREAIS